MIIYRKRWTKILWVFTGRLRALVFFFLLWKHADPVNWRLGSKAQMSIWSVSYQEASATGMSRQDNNSLRKGFTCQCSDLEALRGPPEFVSRWLHLLGSRGFTHTLRPCFFFFASYCECVLMRLSWKITFFISIQRAWMLISVEMMN